MRDPAEQILLAALYDRWDAWVNPELKRLQGSFCENYPAWEGVFTVFCGSQKTITTFLPENTYRVDFFIYLTRFRLHDAFSGDYAAMHKLLWPELGKLIVEVDGHDYHDRTKEQASYDRKRDRGLTHEGYRVVRFTGSDVFNHPDDCVEDIDYHLNDLAETILRNYRDRGEIEALIYG